MRDTATSEDNLAVSYQVKHSLTLQSAIILLGIYPSELKTYVHAKTCTRMSVATSFIVPKNWKHHGILQHGNGQADCGPKEYTQQRGIQGNATRW